MRSPEPTAGFAAWRTIDSCQWPSWPPITQAGAGSTRPPREEDWEECIARPVDGVAADADLIIMRKEFEGSERAWELLVANVADSGAKASSPATRSAGRRASRKREWQAFVGVTAFLLAKAASCAIWRTGSLSGMLIYHIQKDQVR
jgi:hypothetical protein